MNAPHVDAIVQALLYEGYILYPYRSSSVKNRQRWNFGVLYPRRYAEQQTGADASSMQTECLVQGAPDTSLDITVRFLRLVDRMAARSMPFETVPFIEVDGQIYESWQEAAEDAVSLIALPLGDLVPQPLVHQFRLPETWEIQTLSASAELVRSRQAIAGRIEISAEPMPGGVFRLRVRIANASALPDNSAGDRDQALARAMISAHTVLAVTDGEFVSLLDPPDQLREAAEACRNIGTWPVLVGETGRRDTMLSSPIILYDYPQVAPESPGDLFDGTEIDEILTLRILTLTEDEKAAMRRSDDHARRLLDRAASLPPDHFMKLHGVLRT